MQIKIFQVDAFTSKLFGGNPAAICPLEEWIPDIKMQQIAFENNLSETGFFVPEDDFFRLRWFTPITEVDLCGHATLAAAYVLFNHLGYKEKTIRFKTRSGILSVSQNDELLTMNFPSTDLIKVDTPPDLIEGLGYEPVATYQSDDLLALYDSEEMVARLDPDFMKLSELSARGIIVTAKGNSVDFVSRFFAPAVGINEDPVTGSAHTKLTPFWASRLGKNELTAVQLSERKGELKCKYLGDRVEISGKAVTYLVGEITV